MSASIRGNHIFGAGVVIGPRHVLTCRHVIENMRSIDVSIAERAAVPARVVDQDAELDLAVLELEHPQADHALLGSSTTLQMGDRVFAMGAPRNMMFSLNAGIVSYVGRPYSDIFYIQTDIPTNAGNSGGPVLDERGRVVGISSFILRNAQGLAFALPIDYAYSRFGEFFAARMNPHAFEQWLATRPRPRQPAKMATRARNTETARSLTEPDASFASAKEPMAERRPGTD